MEAIQKALEQQGELLQKLSERQDGIEKTFARIGRQGGGDDTHDIIRKAMMDGRGGHAGSAGWDGADTLGLLRIAGGKHQKALGWGSLLRDLSTVMNPYSHPFTGYQGNQGLVQKSLDTARCYPVNKAAMAEGAGATGGYTVPVQFYADLLRLVAEDAFVRQMCTVMPMQSLSMYVPALNQTGSPAAGTSAFFGGIIATWQPEAQTIAQSNPTFNQIQLTARTLEFYTVASNQLLQDNAVALDTLLTTLFKEGMAWFYDYYILRGNGSDQPLGILNAPGTYSQSRTTATSFVFADVANMLSHFLMTSWTKGCWVMHPSLIPQLFQLADSTNGRLIWLSQYGTSGEGGLAQKMPLTLVGLPIYFTEKVPKLGTAGDVSLVDMSKYIVGDRMAIQIETSPHVLFLNNQMVWRIIARWDGQPWVQQPIYLADGSGSYQVSPYVALAA